MKTIKRIMLYSTFIIAFNINVNAQLKLNSAGQISVGTESTNLDIDTISTIKINGIKDFAPRIAFGNNSELTIGKLNPTSRKILLHATQGISMTSLDGYTFFSYSYSEPYYHNLYLNCDVNVNSIYSKYDSSTLASDSEISAIDALCDITCSESTNTKLGVKTQQNATINVELLESYFPGTVKTDSVGQTYINYHKLIPLLINAIVELKGQLSIENSEITTSPISSKSTDYSLLSIDVLDATIIEPKLYQNTPNPFNSETTIKYALPKNVINAEIYIYNLQGNQIRKYSIRERGENYLHINASELEAGMYLYTLISDGKEIDTKRMILTQ